MTTKVLRPNVQIPGPPAMPVIGSRGNLVQFMRDPVGYFIMLNRRYGEVATIVHGVPKGMVMGFGPKYNQQILSDAETYPNTNMLHKGPEGSANHRVGLGLLSMSGERHKRIRRLMSPFFHYKVVPTYHGPVASLVEELLSGWSDGMQVNMHTEMNNLTKRFSIKMLLGLDDPEYALSVADLMEEWHKINMSFAARALPVDFPGFPYRHMLKLAEKLERQLKELIEEKRKLLADGKNDALSALLRAGEEEGAPLTDDELTGQVNFLFGASFETTANSLSWTLFLLSQHPQIMERLYEELDDVLGGRVPAYEELEKLSLLDRVIKEALRLFAPPVYACRLASKDVAIGDYEVPKGTIVAFSHYITHHMEEIYEEAQRFNPDRWLTIKPSNYEYLPFGAGAHACLGYGLSNLLMKMALSTILQRYRLTVVPGSKIARHWAITLHPKYGVPMTITKQDRQFASSKTEVRGNVHEMVDLR